MSSVTYRPLHGLLRDLGFVDRSVPDAHTLFQLPDSNIVVLHALHEPDERATAIDVRKVRVILDQNGLLDARDFDRFVEVGKLPHSGSARGS